MLGRFGKDKGFTLLELMIVIAIVGILATLAQPMFKNAVLKSKEAALKENLFNLRNVLDQYYADNGEYPPSLIDLVEKGYMRKLPMDPFTENTDWNEEYIVSDEYNEDVRGIFDVHSLSDRAGINGVPYSDW